MDFNATIDLIIRELEEAREILDDLKKFPDAPLLEIELAKSKIRNAGEVIAFLKQRNENAASRKKPEVTDENISYEHPREPVRKSEEKKDPGKPEIESDEQKPFVAPIIADTFSHLANRFNEQIGEKQNDDFSYSHGRRYTNLTEAIGINDRFYYIRELFDSNRDAYNEAISRLEKAQDLNEAKAIVLSYRKDKRDNPAIKQLLDLVKRKFAGHE